MLKPETLTSSPSVKNLARVQIYKVFCRRAHGRVFVMLKTPKGPCELWKTRQKDLSQTLFKVVKWMDDIIEDVLIGKNISLPNQLAAETIPEPV